VSTKTKRSESLAKTPPNVHQLVDLSQVGVPRRYLASLDHGFLLDMLLLLDIVGLLLARSGFLLGRAISVDSALAVGLDLTLARRRFGLVRCRSDIAVCRSSKGLTGLDLLDVLLVLLLQTHE
jgi:hypothetical protein